MAWMVRVFFNVPGSGQVSWVCYVLEGRERAANDFLSSPYDPLQGLLVGHWTGSVPHCESVCQDTFNHRVVKSSHDLGAELIGSKHTEEVKALVRLFQYSRDVLCPSGCASYVNTQECESADYFHTFAIYVKWEMLVSSVLPKVQNELFSLCLCSVSGCLQSTTVSACGSRFSSWSRPLLGWGQIYLLRPISRFGLSTRFLNSSFPY